jgi:methylthioribose-1-phosphate isomerase
MLPTVERTPEAVRLVDQRRLPVEENYLDFTTPEEVAGAIRDMVVRGAPAIGVTAAFGIALGATRARSLPRPDFERRMEAILDLMSRARPTAVNLFWAIERMRRVLASAQEEGASGVEIAARLEDEAARIHDEDLAACRAIGEHGGALVPDGGRVLTHCNAGGLATAGYGTALGVIRGARDAGKTVRVWADETRPFLQGARLTAWELMKDGIETTVLADVAAATLLRRGAIDLVVVGADRIAANGDVANKIGTYPLAVLAREHGVPFYVAAPTSTIDPDCPDGSAIPIEERESREVTELFGTRVAPAGVGVFNPAFDVTPARLVTAIVTERGIARPPFEAALRSLFAR